MNYQEILEEVVSEVKPLAGKGHVADYIHQLASVDPDKFGMSLNFLDGTEFSIGDTEERFSIQSISKVFMLALAMANVGNELWKRVNVEPSGNPFNSLIQLEYEKGIPRNPFINSGAIVVADILLSTLTNPKEELLQFINSLSGTTVQYNTYVAASEATSGYRNRAMANLMKDFGNIRNDVEEVLDL
ncbi:MAG: glutaminase, partial [Fulvivirga sp.]|nr:glutaminase [Fulvivirga sp.]